MCGVPQTEQLLCFFPPFQLKGSGTFFLVQRPFWRRQKLGAWTTEPAASPTRRFARAYLLICDIHPPGLSPGFSEPTSPGSMIPGAQHTKVAGGSWGGPEMGKAGREPLPREK